MWYYAKDQYYISFQDLLDHLDLLESQDHLDHQEEVLKYFNTKAIQYTEKKNLRAIGPT